MDALRGDVAVETLRETQGARSDIDKLLEGIGSLRLAQAEAERRVSDRQEQQEREIHAFFEKVHGDMTKRLGDYHAEFDTGLSGLREELQGLVAVVQGPEMLEEPTRFLPQPPVPRYLPASFPYHQPPPYHLVTLDEMYALLGIDRPYFLAEDLGIVARAAHAMTPAALGRAAWLLNVPRFRRWVDAAVYPSDIVLVNGHMGGLGKGKLSPLSILAATLATMRHASPDILVLAHFCGLHTAPADDLVGPRGMLRALVAQAVLHLRGRGLQGGTTVATDETLLDGLVGHDITSLCEVLEALLGQLGPWVTVYCVLDNVSEFETSLRGWGGELDETIARLRDMVARSVPQLKVLLSAGNRSIMVHKMLDADDCVSLSAGNVHAHPVQRLSLERGWEGAMSSRE